MSLEEEYQRLCAEHRDLARLEVLGTATAEQLERLNMVRAKLDEIEEVFVDRLVVASLAGKAVRPITKKVME